MQSPHTVSFNLKQHTPLIHFQYDQSGATLRGSEVKPKLDKFIIKNYFENNFTKFKKYLTGWDISKEAELKNRFEKENYFALDYKIKIHQSQNFITESIEEGFPCFFGNMGDSKEKYKFSFTSDPITIELTSPHSELLSAIERDICHFFGWYNFGTRQSKGFGSFYLDSKDSLYEDYPEYYTFFSKNNITQRGSLNSWAKTIFHEIDLINKSMRSGINESYRQGIYMKPILWHYFASKNINWEKRAIKKNFFSDQLTSQISRHDVKAYSPLNFNSNDYRLVRDLCGLSTSEEWGRHYNNSIVKKSHPDIERFQSPFFFKPIFSDNICDIYLHAFDIDDKYLNTSFEIQNEYSHFQIKTPETFKPIELLHYMTNGEFDIADLITQGNRNNTEGTLVKIFRELKKNRIL